MYQIYAISQIHALHFVLTSHITLMMIPRSDVSIRLSSMAIQYVKYNIPPGLDIICSGY